MQGLGDLLLSCFSYKFLSCWYGLFSLQLMMKMQYNVPRSLLLGFWVDLQIPLGTYATLFVLVMKVPNNTKDKC